MSDETTDDLSATGKLTQFAAILRIDPTDDETEAEFVQRLLDCVDDHIISLEELREDIIALANPTE